MREHARRMFYACSSRQSTSTGGCGFSGAARGVIRIPWLMGAGLLIDWGAEAGKARTPP